MSTSARHHAFMQALMARRVMAETDARELYRELCRVDNDTGFDAFWGVCNKELSFLGLDIRRVNLPPEADEAPVRYVGVVNKVNDSLAKEATRMTPPQVALFRAILMAVCTDVEAATRGLSSLAVLNLPLIAASTELSQLGNKSQGEDGTQAGPASQPAPAGPALRLSASDKESALAQLVADGWLFGDSKSSYRLGPRSFLELGRLFMEVADDDVKEAWGGWI